ncbi:MAG: hypothetical protein LBS30_07250 [Planctomycetota bacterium]|jgi:hydroxypyruvate isomerase|nr:hypothetical protein [Planctomycetota bacterium]
MHGLQERHESAKSAGIIETLSGDAAMKKSLCIETMFGDAPFAERFAKTRAAGFDFVEFSDWTNLDITRAGELLLENRLALTSISGARNHFLDDPDQREDFLEFLSQSIAVAKSFACSNIVVACESGSGGRAPIIDALTAASRKTARAGMTLLVRPDTAGSGDRACGPQSIGDAVNALSSPSLRLLYETRRDGDADETALDTLRKYRDVVAYIRVCGDPDTYSRLRRALTEELDYNGVVGFRIDTVGREERCLEAIRNF